MSIISPLPSSVSRPTKFFVTVLVLTGLVSALGVALTRRATAGAPAPFPVGAAGVAAAPATQAKSGLRPAYSVTWERTLTSPDGQTRWLLVITKRYQRADGALKIVHTFYDEKGTAAGENVYFGLAGLGFFRADDESRTLVFITPVAADEEPEDVAAFLRSQPEFDREEEVRGQRTIVWRKAAEGGKGDTEEYRAPALRGLILKQVVSSARGQEVFEPTEITLGEPAGELFAKLSSYQVDYAHFEGKIREMERDGNKETAHAMRQALSRMQQARPDGR